MLHSISYLFPSMENTATTTVLCYIQALLNSLSDLCTIMVATAVMITSYLNFTQINFILKNKGKVLILMCLICWIFPLVFCIIIFIYGNIWSNGGAFCWVHDIRISYIYFSFCFINYCIFFIVLYKVSNGIKEFLKSTNSIELNDKYNNAFKIQSSVVIFTFCIFSINFSMTTVWAIDGYIPGQIYFWLLIIATVGEMISCPAYAIIYCFNHEKFKEFKRVICCRKDSLTSSKMISSDVALGESDLSGLSGIM